MAPWFTRHRSKDKVTFSERQRLRKADELPLEETDVKPVFPLGGHRSKPDKVTFAERQRLRKADALDDEEAVMPLAAHRSKKEVTFAERQRRRRRGVLTEEAEVLKNLDQIFGFGEGGLRYESDDESQPATPASEQSESPASLERQAGQQEGTSQEVVHPTRKPKSRPFRLRFGNSAKRLFSGAVAGAVSRTAVAPLETIRTHLMVGSNGKTVTEVFKAITEKEGWKGLFRGNGINVLRVTPAKAIELYTFDAAKKVLHPLSHGENAPLRGLPISLFAGSAAGVASTICTYPLELVKTRLTIQPGVYKGITDAFARIALDEGFLELYRGLLPSLIGIVPYAGSNYFAYDTLKQAYRRFNKKERISPGATLVLGSLAGALASTATFPLEVARKQMQVGRLGGRVVYKNTLDALQGIVKEKGIGGLYFGLAPSCLKLMPAAGISFMCYEALKLFLLEDVKKQEDAREAADAKVKEGVLSKPSEGAA